MLDTIPVDLFTLLLRNTLSQTWQIVNKWTSDSTCDIIRALKVNNSGFLSTQFPVSSNAASEL